MDRNDSSYTLKKLILLSMMILSFLSFSFVSVVYFYPFILAFLFSLLFLPVVNFLETHWNWNRAFATLFVIGSFIFVLLTIVTFIIAELVHGLSYLMKVLPAYIDEILATTKTFLNSTIFPFIHTMAQFTSGLGKQANMNFDQTTDQLLSQAGLQVGNALQFILNNLRNFFLAIPHAMTMILFSLLASFFVTKDWPQIISWLDKHTPKRLFQFTNRIFLEWKSAVGHYLVAQLTLVSITGVIVFIGLLVLNVDYAFTTSLLIAAVDILPYIGTGIVFLPWIIYSFLNGSWFMTIGLAVLYSIVVLQRQISEPKIISHHIGTPTLIFLFTIFACYQFFGFAGVLFGPLVLIVTQSFVRAGVVDEIKTFLGR